MRELTKNEMDEVAGGNPWAAAAFGGFALGALTSGVSAALGGSSFRGTMTAAALGGVSGAAGGVASVTTGVVRVVNIIRSVGHGVAASAAGATIPGEPEEQEIEVAK